MWGGGGRSLKKMVCFVSAGGRGVSTEGHYSYNVYTRYRLKNINRICENLFVMCLCMYGVGWEGGGRTECCDIFWDSLYCIIT